MKYFFKNTKFVIVLSLLVGLGITLFIQIKLNSYIEKLLDNQKMLYRYYNHSVILQKVTSGLALLESNMRGFVITGESEYFETYKQEKENVKKNVEMLTDNFPSQNYQNNIYQLSQLVEDKINHTEDVIKIYHSKGQKSAMEEINTGLGQRIMQKAKVIPEAVIVKLKNETINLIHLSETQTSKIRQWELGIIFISLLVILISILLLFKDINHRNLLQTQINIAMQEAESTALLKGQFMANMSHEIRTPMNSIVGFTNLLAKTHLDQKQADYVKTINHAGENLLSIINDILDFSKIEAGMFRIEKLPFDITSLLHSVYTMFIEKCKEKNLAIKFELDDRIPKLVLGDPTRLTQILLNLIGNAIKFTEKGQILISARVIEFENNKVIIEYSVKDTGIGIPEDKLEEIFERFNQGNANTTRQFGGTGLGLALVKNLVELQSGTVHVKSSLGKGATFTFIITYPISDSVQLKSNGNISVKKIDRTVKILIVEDNLMNQKLASAVLSDFGFESNIASNGQIALEMLKIENYDIVLLDLQMPVLDGYQTAEKIRQKLKSDIPIIAMTAHVLPAEKEKCITLGMNDYITKPFKENELYDIIVKHLQDKITLSSIAANIEKTLEKPDKVGESIVDLTYLLELSKGKKTFIVEMINIFLQDNPNDLKNIAKAISESDFETIKAIAHKMKTSISFIGLSQKIGANLGAMENLTEENKNMDYIKKHFATVKAVCETAQEDLWEYKKGL